MRHALAALALGALPALASPATAQSDELNLSAQLAQEGIGPTIAAYQDKSDPTDAERFALGGLYFLNAVEQALQHRYRVNVSHQFEIVPVLRLPLPRNPNAEPFRPELIEEVLMELVWGMDKSDSYLTQIPETAEFGVTLRLADIWFDINDNKARDEGEDLLDVAGMLFAGTGFDRRFAEQIEIRFDVADSRWLSAYSNLIRGVSHVVLAYNPTKAITEVMQSQVALAELSAGSQMANAVDYMVGDYVNTVGIALLALRSEPSKASAEAALASFEAVIAQNRAFWRLVAAETDNTAEWIPNDAQTSALGLTFPEGTGESWQAVLAEAEQLLRGELLVPYWRLGEAVGLNVRKMFFDPRPVDLVGWVLGPSALPYAERGTRISGQSLMAFDRLMQGRGLMFAAILN